LESVDALGNLVRFRLMPGQRGATTALAESLEGLNFSALLGDKAFDADWLRSDFQRRGGEAVILPRAKRLNQADYDDQKNKLRQLIKNFFQKIKEFRSWRKIMARPYLTLCDRQPGPHDGTQSGRPGK
jgi:transposase